MYPPLCGSGVAHAYLVLPRDVPIPKRPKQVQGDSGVAAAMWEWLVHA